MSAVVQAGCPRCGAPVHAVARVQSTRIHSPLIPGGSPVVEVVFQTDRVPHNCEAPIVRAEGEK